MFKIGRALLRPKNRTIEPSHSKGLQHKLVSVKLPYKLLESTKQTHSFGFEQILIKKTFYGIDKFMAYQWGSKM